MAILGGKGWEQLPRLLATEIQDGDGQVRCTRPRNPVKDLDSLPFPAYDLINMQSYGMGSRTHPLAGSALRRGRGIRPRGGNQGL